MSTPPLPPPGSGSKTSTQEIPVVPAAVANTQHLPPPPAPEGMRTTGPVDFVPEPPSAAAPGDREPAGPAASESRRPAVHRGALPAAGVAVLGVAALELGLSLQFGTGSFWSGVPLWSAFASLAAAVVLVAVAGEGLRVRRMPAVAARMVAGAVAGLVAFWLLVVLNVAATDRGFVLTAAVACLAAAGLRLRRDRAAA